MKLLKSIFATTALAAMTATMVSCDDNDPEGDAYFLLVFENENIKYSTETQAWDECYLTSAENSLNYADFHFSHSANEAWQSWTGFCPTKSKDNADHSTNWISYQWGSITGGGVYNNIPYMLCFWDSYNERDASEMPENPSLSIKFTNSTYDGFYPDAISITNSAYGYYAMKNGTDFNRAFEPGDRFSVIIIGKYKGTPTGRVVFDLADGRDILKEWKDCNLSSLGRVDELYFRMESTDTSEWGINNPTYFCLDNLRFTLTKTVK